MNALKRARVDRKWSQSRLIAAMDAEAGRMRTPIPGHASLKTQISRWENAHLTPDSLYQRLFERIYGMSASQLGFQADDSIGLTVGATWEQCIDSSAELWSEDMKRRTFLQSAAFAATAYTTPVLTALISDPAEVVVRSGRERAVALNDVAVIRDLTAKLNQLDNRHGGGHVRRLALAVLDDEVAPLLRSGNFTDKVGRELLGAVAEVTQLVGWMSHDVGASLFGLTPPRTTTFSPISTTISKVAQIRYFPGLRATG